MGRFKKQAIRLPLLALALGAMSGCGNYLDKFSRLAEKDSTLVNFSLGPQQSAGAVSIASTPMFGVMVYGVRNDGSAISIPLTSEAEQKSVQLPNGGWRFYAVGWDAVALGGNAFCGTGSAGGIAGEIQLTGGATSVSLNLSQTNCNSDTFSASLYRSGSTFISPNFVFCGATTDMSGFNSASNCQNGFESARFFKGRVSGSGVEGADRAEYDPVSKRLLYSSDAHQDGRWELFSVTLNGTDTVRQNPALVVNGSIDEFDIIPGTNKAIYMADQDTYNVNELYITTIGTEGSTKISGAVLGSGVRDFEITEDGNYVVFAAEIDNAGVVEVYSKSLTNLAAAPVKLSPTAAGNGIFQFTWGWGLLVSGNSQRVVFAGKFDSSTAVELYSAPIYTAGSSIKLHSTSAVGANFAISDFDINYNDTKVVWSGDFLTDNKNIFYASSINTAASEVALHGAVGNGTSMSEVVLSPTADLAAFAVDPSGTPGQYELYVANFNNLGAVTTTKVHDSINTVSQQYRDIRFTPDNSKIVYLTDEASSPNYRLFSALTNTASSKVDLTHATLGSSIPYSSGGGTSTVSLMDNTYVFYRADGNVFPGQMGLYKAVIGSASSGTLISQSHVGSQEVIDFELDDGKAFYAIDDAVDGEHRIYVYSSGSYSLLNTGSAAYQIKSIHVPGAENSESQNNGVESIAEYPYGLFFQGRKLAASSSEDLYFVYDYTAASPVYRRLTYSYGGGNGQGKMRFTMLEFKRDPGGNLNITGPGISSPCLDGPATDGGPIASTAAVPAGSGAAPSPFATAIEIFPNAPDCNGPPVRVLFPFGYANWASSPSASKLKVIGSGVSRIFVKD